MRKVIGIGETVLDILFKKGKPMDAVPGGSVFNTIVSLSRSGVDTAFVSEVGCDLAGSAIVDFMKDNGICTDYMKRRNDMKTPLSLAFLNENNDAEYNFYRSPMRNYIDVAYPEIRRDDILIIGSFYSVCQAMRPHVSGLLDSAAERGAIIIYDVNFRNAHRADLPFVRVNIDENMEYADIIRGSRQDFETVFDMDDPDMVYNAEIGHRCKRMIYTDGPNGVTLIDARGNHYSLTPPPTMTVSTVGAGDNFNAGLAYGLIRKGITRQQLLGGLHHKVWNELLAYGQDFAIACCMEQGNYVPAAFGNKMKAGINDAMQTHDN